MAPIELYPFRFRDPCTGKWVRARYLATLAELASRYREWEIIGPAKIRGDAAMQMFQPVALTMPPAIRRRERGRHQSSTTDASRSGYQAERRVIRSFLPRC